MKIILWVFAWLAASSLIDSAGIDSTPIIMTVGFIVGRIVEVTTER
ncbi:MAG: hypothetical protein ACRC91_23130 [Aeromonas sp.]